MSNRDLRQRDLVPPAKLLEYSAVVVGVGAIGRQVAIQLSAMGIPKLILYDDDVVDEVNLAVQGFREKDLAFPKVQAVAEACQELHQHLQILPMGERFRRGTRLPADITGNVAVYCCVDSTTARRVVFETLKGQIQFFVDGRMAAETLRVITSSFPAGESHYPKTLFDDASAFPAPCTGRSTLYAASVAAGMMVCRFARHLRGEDASGDLLLNLLADELVLELTVSPSTQLKGGLC